MAGKLRQFWRESDSSPRGTVSVLLLSSDRGEPRHVHVGRDERTAKFWLEPVGLEYNEGFGSHELQKIKALVQQHQPDLVRAWDGYFRTRR